MRIKKIAIYLSLMNSIIGLAVAATCCCRGKKSDSDESVGLTGHASLAISNISGRGLSTAQVEKIEDIADVIADVQFTSSIVNLDFLTLIPLGCITDSDFHKILEMQTLGPFIFGATMLIAFKLL